MKKRPIDVNTPTIPTRKKNKEELRYPFVDSGFFYPFSIKAPFMSGKAAKTIL